MTVEELIKKLSALPDQCKQKHIDVYDLQEGVFTYINKVYIDDGDPILEING